MTRLESLAEAIQKYEGWRPLSRSWRNNNPGNLRSSQFQAGQKNGFAYFSSYASGWIALWWNLYTKCSGRNTLGLRPTSQLIDLFEIWAPEEDGNNPTAYANFVAQYLSIPIQTQLGWFIEDIKN